MAFCANCGKALQPTDTFCSSCGEQVKPTKGTSSSNTRYQTNQPPTGSPSPSSYPPPKRLYKSPDNKVIAGICGGLAEYLNMDPTLVRVGMVLFTIFGPGLFAYLLLAILLEERPLT